METPPSSASAATPAAPAIPSSSQSGQSKSPAPQGTQEAIGKTQAEGQPIPGTENKAPAKPANQVEADLQEALGEEWETLTPKAKERLIAGEMRAREGDKRMQLAAKLKKDLDMTTAQTVQLIEALKKDPWKVLSNPTLGHDTKKLAEEYVWQMIQEQRMTPEQREAAQAKLELAQLKSEKEQAQKDREQQEMETLVAQRRAYWAKTIPEAIDAANLPKTSYVIERFIQYIKAAAKQRVPADMPTIAQNIRQELVDLQSKFLLPPKRDGETDDQYEDRVLTGAPNDYVKLLRKADLKKLRAKGLAPKPGPRPQGQAPVAADRPKKMDMSEWLNNRDQRLGRK